MDMYEQRVWFHAACQSTVSSSEKGTWISSLKVGFIKSGGEEIRGNSRKWEQSLTLS